ncbi:MAG: end-binding protein Ku [Acidimicrobiaceae bacterium]|jgi:DNA end-binding protein Ku|nr:end-binding protein Ku [Acidimicrobiaceae bacterium]
MARAIWSGAISFGLVNVPVKAYTAVRDHRVHFNQVEKGTGARIRYEKVSEKTGKEVDKDDIQLGYQLDRGRSVIVDPDELEELRPRSTRTIDVDDFVNLDDIDPIYYDHTYWLAPDGESAQRAYRLLLQAMDQSNRVGIGAVVMRNKQYLAAIRPLDGALAMSTMRFSDEVVPQADIDQLSVGGKAKPEAKELKLASQIIDSLATDWDPTRYHDTYTEELLDLIERRAEGDEVTVDDSPPPSQAKVVDLMEALQASLDAAKKSGSSAAKASPKKATASKKSPARKKAAGSRKSSSSRKSA